MSIKKQTVQGVFWAIIQNWGSQAMSFIVFLILTRLLNPEDFGLVALVNVLISFMIIFLDQGFSAALIQIQDLELAHINTAFWLQVFTSFLLTIISFFASDEIAQLFNQSQLNSLIKVMAILFIISALSQTQIALLKRKFLFKVLAIRALLGIFIAAIVGIIMASSGWGAWSLVGQQLTYESVGAVVLWTASKWRPKWQFSWRHLSELLSFSVNLLGYKLIDFFSQKTDNLLVYYFLGQTALGYYVIAHRILEVMTQLLIGTINQVALPTFSRLQKDSQGFLQAYYKASQLSSLIAFPLFLSLSILAPQVVSFFFGEKWQATIPIMRILAFVGIIRVVSIFQGSAFMALGQPLVQFKLGLIKAIFNLIACLFAVRWGISAVALAYVMSDYLIFPVGQWLLSRLIQLSWKTYLSQFESAVICSFIMVVILLVAQHLLTPCFNTPMLLTVCSLLGALVYTMSLRILFPKLTSQIFSLVTVLKTAPTTEKTEL